MENKMEELGLYEAHLVEKLSGQRFSDEDRDMEFNVALGYVLNLREDKDSARGMSINAHKQAFSDYFYELKSEQLTETFEKYGFAGGDEDSKSE